MTVLGSGKLCSKKPACPEFTSLWSDGGGLKKHIADSTLGEKKKNSPGSQSVILRSLGWEGGVIKTCESSRNHLLSVAGLPGETRSRLSAILFSGSTDTGPHRKQLGAQVWMWSGEMGRGDEGGPRKGRGEGRGCFFSVNTETTNRPELHSLPTPSPGPARGRLLRGCRRCLRSLIRLLRKHAASRVSWEAGRESNDTKTSLPNGNF